MGINYDDLYKLKIFLFHSGFWPQQEVDVLPDRAYSSHPQSSLDKKDQTSSLALPNSLLSDGFSLPPVIFPIYPKLIQKIKIDSKMKRLLILLDSPITDVQKKTSYLDKEKKTLFAYCQTLDISMEEVIFLSFDDWPKKLYACSLKFNTILLVWGVYSYHFFWYNYYHKNKNEWIDLELFSFFHFSIDRVPIVVSYGVNDLDQNPSRSQKESYQESKERLQILWHTMNIIY